MQKATNILWQNSQVSQQERQQLLGQKSLTVWLTGLSAAGKSTLAFALEKSLIQQGRACYVLDGDNVRHGLNNDLGFSETDRHENIRRIAEVAKLMNDAGLIVITAFITPFKSDRAQAATIIGHENYKEIYLSTPLNICQNRDPKGLYKKALNGEIKNFTGISSPYEVPDAPSLTVNTAELDYDAALNKLLDFIANS